MSTTVAPAPSPAPEASAPQPDRYKWIALSNTTIGMLITTINSSIVLIALPDIFALVTETRARPATTSVRRSRSAQFAPGALAARSTRAAGSKRPRMESADQPMEKLDPLRVTFRPSMSPVMCCVLEPLRTIVAVGAKIAPAKFWLLPLSVSCVVPV